MKQGRIKKGNFCEKDLYAGIDPGERGGVCFLREDGSIFQVISMPRDADEFLKVFEVVKNRIKKVFLEKQWAFPEQGVRSAFVLGERYGFLKGMLTALGLEVEEVISRSWQNFFFNEAVIKEKENRNKRRKCLKRLSLSLARSFYPEAEIRHDGQSDAILICLYGMKKIRERKSEAGEKEKKSKIKKIGK